MVQTASCFQCLGRAEPERNPAAVWHNSRETQAKGRVQDLRQSQDERFTSAHLHNLLQRPLSHLWAQDNPDFAAKHGKACWQPPVW